MNNRKYLAALGVAALAMILCVALAMADDAPAKSCGAAAEMKCNHAAGEACTAACKHGEAPAAEMKCNHAAGEACTAACMHGEGQAAAMKCKGGEGEGKSCAMKGNDDDGTCVGMCLVGDGPACPKHRAQACHGKSAEGGCKGEKAESGCKASAGCKGEKAEGGCKAKAEGACKAPETK